MQTGQNIAQLRKDAGMTQSNLAEALHVSRDLVAKWEAGKRLPDYGTVLVIAELFQADPEDLISKDALLMQELSVLFPENCTADPDRLREALNGFLSTVSMRDAGVFVRRYYFLEDPADIGEMYGIRTNYVRTVLARTRKKLKKYLKEALS